jgi:hypothetical protein
MKNPLQILIASSLLPLAAGAQFSVVAPGSLYTQDFSGVPYASNGVSAWNNNSTLPGWSVSAANLAAATAVAGVYNGSSFLASANLNPAEATYFLKAIQANQDGDNRIGTRTGSAPGNVFVTFQATNSTGATLNGFDLSYQGSQFLAREAGSLWVSYSLDGGTWTKIDALTYDAPVTSPGSNLELNASQIAASEQSLSASVSGLSWAAGSDIWIQWAFYRDVPGGSGGNSPVLAMDDVAFTPVPEPATYALLLGALGLGLALWRRRQA